jgi:hypothetical protein
MAEFRTTRLSRTFIYVPEAAEVVEQPCHKEYETFVYGTGVEYGPSTCPPAADLFLDIDTPARDLIQIFFSVEFTVNDAYLNPENYVIIDLSTNKRLNVRRVLEPFNSPTSDRIMLVVDKHVTGTEYSITIEGLVQRNGLVLDPTTGNFFARDAKANSMIAATPDHYNTDPQVSTMRHILQALTESDDRIGSLR